MQGSPGRSTRNIVVVSPTGIAGGMDGMGMVLTAATPFVSQIALNAKMLGKNKRRNIAAEKTREGKKGSHPYLQDAAKMQVSPLPASRHGSREPQAPARGT